jgi:hypothetical protein
LEQLAQIALTYVLSIQNTDLIKVTLRLWRQKAILRLLLWKPLQQRIDLHWSMQSSNGCKSFSTPNQAPYVCQGRSQLLSGLRALSEVIAADKGKTVRPNILQAANKKGSPASPAPGPPAVAEQPCAAAAAANRG